MQNEGRLLKTTAARTAWGWCQNW